MTITTVGPHRVQHGSITAGLATLMGDDRAALCYSDPPWGQGNVTYWQTMNQKMNPGAQREQIDLDDFLGHVLGGIATYVHGVALVEYGQAWADHLIQRAATYDLRHAGTVRTLYRSGKDLRPLDLHVFGTQGRHVTIPDGWREAVHDTHGYATLQAAFPAFAQPGQIVLDPCCGMGYTAQAAIDNGMAFRGLELNAKRLDKTIARLRRSQL